LSDELDFFVNISPERYALPVAEGFLDFIASNRETLQIRYGVESPDTNSDGTLGGNPLDKLALPRGRADIDRAAWLHVEKLTADLRRVILMSGLGVKHGDWICVAPELAAVYVAALADKVAHDNDLAVITDQPDAHGILNGWNVDTLARVLLGDGQDREALDADEVGAMYAAVAIRTVVPARIGDIPVEKIIEVRRRLAAEFDAFRDHLNSLADRLTELGRIKDASVLQARLELMVERDLRRPTDALEGQLRQLGLEPARAVLGLKSLELPAAAAAAVSAAALPAGIGEAGLVAARLITSGIETRDRRRQMLQSSPAGYLLGLQKQLTPGGIVERLRRTMRRAGDNARPSPRQ